MAEELLVNGGVVDAPGVSSQGAEQPEVAGQEPVRAEADSSEQSDGKPKGGKAGGWQKRVDRLTQKNYELQDRLRDYQTRERAALAKGIQPLDEEGAADKWVRNRQLQEEQGLEPLNASERREIERELQANEQLLREHLPAGERALTPDPDMLEAAVQQRVRHELVIRDHTSRLEVASQAYPDWDQVTREAAADDVNFHPQLGMIIAGLPNSADVTYALCKDRNLTRKIATMAPELALGEIVRLSSQVAPPLEEDASARSAVNKPAPIRPVRKPAPTSTGLADDLSTAEWMRRRNAQKG